MNPDMHDLLRLAQAAVDRLYRDRRTKMQEYLRAVAHLEKLVHAVACAAA